MRHRQIGIALGLAALLAALTMGPVAATYPGEHNGRIAVGVRANGAANIFTMRADGSGMRQLTFGPGFKLCPSYSPDGQTIAYCATAGDAFEIWTMKQNGKKQRQLTHLGGFATFPDFSPDASKIAFAGSEGNDPNGEIYVVNARTGGSLHALTSCASFAPGCFNDLPVWSPDGTKIAFIHADDSNDEGVINQQVWVMDSDGQHQHPLTSSPVPHDQVADWSPDGSKIAYLADTSGAVDSGGNGDIYVMDANGNDPHPITSGGHFLGTAWSPDGSRITTLDFPSHTVYTLNAADGSDLRAVHPGDFQFVPGWQPRGTGAGEEDDG